MDDQLTFDCIRWSAKVGEIGMVCALFERRLATAFPGKSVQRSDDASVVLAVELSEPQGLDARVDWRGRGKGNAVRDARLGDQHKADLIDTQLKASLKWMWFRKTEKMNAMAPVGLSKRDGF